MALEVGLRNEIVALLVTHPMFQDENGWRASLLSAGLEGQLPYLDLHGVPYNVITQLVNRLDLHGTLADGRPSLVALLQAAAGQVGQDRQAHIRNLCERISAPPEVDLTACPYRGLEVFREQDANVFFGRADVAATLQQMVAQQPLTALIGASGSGKSSVVYAGLLPLLRKQPRQLIAVFRPGAEPFRAVAAAILPLLEPNLSETDRLIELRKLADALTQENLSLTDILERIRQKAPPAARLLLFADQFEELYTLCPAGASRQRFLDEMLKTCEVSWLLTLRADFLSQVLDYSPFANMLDRYPPKLLGRMTEEQLRAVIEQPALKAGVTLEVGLSDHILREVGQEPGNLPLLEFALQALWQRMTGRCLTHAAYEAIGGVNQALTRHADAVLAEFATPEQQAQVRRIMVQLVSPGAGTEDTRQAATRDQVKDWDVVQHLADKRLVVTGRPEDSNVETVEVVHEALIRHWQPLRNWMQEDRVFRMWQNNLRQVINDWEKAGKDDGALLRGARLADAEEKLAQFADALSDAEKAYITASVALRQQEQEARERARREKEQTQRRIMLGLSVGLFIMLFAGFSGMQWQRAEQQRRRAEEQRNETLKIQSLFLSDLARQQNEHQNYGDALLLALEALPQSIAQPDRPYVSEVDVQLYYATTHLHEQLVLTGHEGGVNSALFSPDGTCIVTASNDNTVRVWDAFTGKILMMLTGFTDYVTSMAFSPDGTRLVTASNDQMIRVWDIATGQELTRLNAYRDRPGFSKAISIVFTPDKALVAQMMRRYNMIQVLDATTGQLLSLLTGHEKDLTSAAFSSDGKRIVTTSDDQTVRVWDVVTGRELLWLGGHDNAVTSAAFSHDRTRIVTVSWDETEWVWDSTTGQKLIQLTGHKDHVNSAEFSPDGTRIVTASDDQTARVWDVTTGQELLSLSGHGKEINSAVFSPDGMRIVTASHDNTARVWDVTIVNEVAIPFQRPERPKSKTEVIMAFSPDGKMILTTVEGKTAQVLDATTRKELAILGGYEGHVSSVAFSSDGMRIVTALTDNTIRIWDTITGKELVRLRGYEGWVSSVKFSPDGMRILTTSSSDLTARVWDIDERKEVVRLTIHDGDVKTATFSPDGIKIIMKSNHGTERVWPVFRNTQELIDYANSIVPRRLTPEERKQYFLE